MVAIPDLVKLTGVPIDVIEKRARPGQYAESGFLGPTEKLQDVLKNDNDTVNQLGTTYIELASHLKKIVSNVTYESKFIFISY